MAALGDLQFSDASSINSRIPLIEEVDGNSMTGSETGQQPNDWSSDSTLRNSNSENQATQANGLQQPNDWSTDSTLSNSNSENQVVQTNRLAPPNDWSLDSVLRNSCPENQATQANRLPPLNNWSSDSTLRNSSPANQATQANRLPPPNDWSSDSTLRNSNPENQATQANRLPPPNDWSSDSTLRHSNLENQVAQERNSNKEDVMQHPNDSKLMIAKGCIDNLHSFREAKGLESSLDGPGSDKHIEKVQLFLSPIRTSFRRYWLRFVRNSRSIPISLLVPTRSLESLTSTVVGNRNSSDGTSTQRSSASSHIPRSSVRSSCSDSTTIASSTSGGHLLASQTQPTARTSIPISNLDNSTLPTQKKNDVENKWNPTNFCALLFVLFMLLILILYGLGFGFFVIRRHTVQHSALNNSTFNW